MRVRSSATIVPIRNREIGFSLPYVYHRARLLTSKPLIGFQVVVGKEGDPRLDGKGRGDQGNLGRRSDSCWDVRRAPFFFKCPSRHGCMRQCKKLLRLIRWSRFCNLRMMAAGNKVPGRPIRRGSNDTDAGFALRKFVEERDEALQEASSLAPPSPHADDFHTRLRLDSDTTLQGTEPRYMRH